MSGFCESKQEVFNKLQFKWIYFKRKISVKEERGISIIEMDGRVREKNLMIVE